MQVQRAIVQGLGYYKKIVTYARDLIFYKMHESKAPKSVLYYMGKARPISIFVQGPVYLGASPLRSTIGQPIMVHLLSGSYHIGLGLPSRGPYPHWDELVS